MVLYLVRIFFPHWPIHQRLVLRDFLRSPRAVFSALTMGRYEMLTLKSLYAPSMPSTAFSSSSSSVSVADVLKHEAKRIWVYYGDGDQWVPEHSAKEVFQVLREHGGARSELEVAASKGKGIGKFQGENSASSRRNWLDGVNGEVVFGSGVPHDFCISEFIFAVRSFHFTQNRRG